MRIIKTETLGITGEEFELLDKVRVLLDEISFDADADGAIAKLSCNAMYNICELLENYEIL